MELSNHIWKASRKYDIPADIYTAILMQESSYNIKAKNCVQGFAEDQSDLIKVCVDFGISQVNIHNIQAYELDYNRLLTDLEYSVEAGAMILSWFAKTYKEKEPESWYCRYNTGTGKKEQIREACNYYVQLVARYI